jgi:hypothetical protein
LANGAESTSDKSQSITILEPFREPQLIGKLPVGYDRHAEWLFTNQQFVGCRQ